jgi:UDP-N-acetylmuramyl pentapeptide phosphotransferase/UDP-N-acetylglucosamine-1-phosphate transferase
MDFIIKPNLDGASSYLTSTEFPQGRIIHPFLGKKNKVCEVIVFDLIITYTKLTTTSNILNLVDGRNSLLSSKA